MDMDSFLTGLGALGTFIGLMAWINLMWGDELEELWVIAFFASLGASIAWVYTFPAVLLLWGIVGAKAGTGYFSSEARHERALQAMRHEWERERVKEQIRREKEAFYDEQIAQDADLFDRALDTPKTARSLRPHQVVREKIVRDHLAT